MARYTYKLISPAEIALTRTYCCRLKTGDEALRNSIRKHGILQPLVVTPSCEVIAGYKRLEAALALSLKGVPVLELEAEPHPQEAFLLAVLSNWHQPFSEIEKAKVIFSAKEKFSFLETEISEEIFPALHMSPDKGFYGEALEIMSLQPLLLDLIVSEKMPFRGARILCHLSAEDQRAFAVLALEAALTTNQLLKAGEWLYDLLKIEKISLSAFIKKYSFEAVLKSDQPRNLKGERLFSKIRALRFPKVAEREKRFLGISEQLRDEKSGLSVEMPPSFEEEGFTLKAKVKSPESLEAVLGTLQSKRKVLNSLLDIVL